VPTSGHDKAVRTSPWSGYERTALMDVIHRPGDLPLIIAAPHGGHSCPDAIVDRETGVTRGDRHTADLAKRITEALSAIGPSPHMVLCNLHRRKVDTNRPLGDASAGGQRAEAAWRAYHEALGDAARIIRSSHGAGLLIDLHGHGRPAPEVMLGYGLHRRVLAADDPALDACAFDSSLHALAARSRHRFSALVRGATSLGAGLEGAGLACTPSPSHPKPTKPYFRGGYTLERHRSIDAIQIEVPAALRATDDLRASLASSLARALGRFLRDHYSLRGA
jgi:hypothetical protein